MNSLDIDKPPAGTRVVVAMSGGVDSSVVAALLAAEGYDVVGVTLQLYDHGAATHRKGACCAGQDVRDARRVAETLGIPHYVLDYEARFRRDVIETFAADYAAGETPIPCVACNRTVKFRDLLGFALDIDADVLATGHYVASRPHGAGRALYRPADVERDQSYFLFATTPEQLARVRFPLGSLTKAETREAARRAGLAVAEKADSQDICFVPQGGYADAVAKLRPDAVDPGDIVDLGGRVLGRHPGIAHFTVGQRRGLNVAAGRPVYVVALDPAQKRVVVGPREALGAAAIGLRDVNWLGDGPLEAAAGAEIDVFARVRSAREPRPARLAFGAGGVEVRFAEPEEGVAPGQACVLYDGPGPGARVLGGGFIRRAVQPAFSDVA